jgi:hypothetical protein
MKATTMKNKYCLLMRAALPALLIIAAFVLNATANAQALPGSLWYNGDFNGFTWLSNEYNTVVSQSNTYDDFNVPSGPGWHVTGLYSADLLTFGFGASSAEWEIRTGVSNGNAGTLVAGGILSPATLMPTGRGGGGFIEYDVLVSGLNITLAPGTYFISVAPSDFGSGRSLNSATSGTNCVGTPCGNDGNSWFNSTFFGVFFGPASDQVGVSPADFSDGVIGNVVPEPATWALLTGGLGALLIAVRRRRSYSNR